MRPCLSGLNLLFQCPPFVLSPYFSSSIFLLKCLISVILQFPLLNCLVCQLEGCKSRNGGFLSSRYSSFGDTTSGTSSKAPRKCSSTNIAAVCEPSLYSRWAATICSAKPHSPSAASLPCYSSRSRPRI